MTREDALAALRDEFLTIKEYAFVTRRNPEHLRQMARTGKLRGALRVDGQWRVRVTCLDAPPSTL